MPKDSEEEKEFLTGYIRRSSTKHTLKVSLNVNTLSDCTPYITSDGQAYIPLEISLSALEKVLSGERAVATISHQYNDTRE